MVWAVEEPDHTLLGRHNMIEETLSNIRFHLQSVGTFCNDMERTGDVCSGPHTDC